MNDSSAIDIANFLSQSLCEAVMVYEVKSLYDYVDYVILATTSSNTHRRGVIEKLHDFFYEKNMDEYAKKAFVRRAQAQGAWTLVDLHDCIIHLMDENTREFYDFEKLLSKAQILYP